MSNPTDRQVVPVILCGGAGSRLWPLSKPDWPKPLVALTGDQTMLQETAARVADDSRFAAPLVVTASAYAAAAEAQMGEAGGAPQLTLVEPCARGTAPAIALAALNLPPDAMMLVLPSDHVIAHPKAFAEAIEHAAAAAVDGWLVTFGITPDRPETGYGYIRQGEPVGPGAFEAARFAEKPDIDTARSWLAQGGWSWNAGIFLMTAGAYLKALDALAPDILSAARDAVDRQQRQGSTCRPDEASLARAPNRSVDHAVMEHWDRVAVVPVEMGWSDVGSWESLHAISGRDEDQNVLVGDALALDSQGCLIRSDGPTVVAVGVQDLVIVATGNEVLVIPRSQSQRVKEAVEALQARNGEER